MAFAMPISYSQMTQQKIIGVKGFVSSFADVVDVPDGPHCGNVTCTVLSAAVPATIVEATMVTNLAVTVAVALTFVDTQLTMSLMPSQAKSFFTKPANLVKLAKNHADGFVYAATGAMLAAMYAASPGKSVALTDSQGNLGTDGTAAEAHENMAKFMSLVAYVMSMYQNAPPDDFGIIAYADAYANLITLRSEQGYGAIFDSQQNIWRFLGIPIYSTSYATNFGVASRPCVYVYHKEAAAIAWDEPEIMGGGPMWHNDGMIKWTTICPYGLAVINVALLAELTNGAAI